MPTKKKSTRKKATPKIVLVDPGTKFPECLTEYDLAVPPLEKLPPRFGSDISDDWMHTAARQVINNDPEGIPDDWLMEGGNAPIPAPKSSLILPPDYMPDAPYVERMAPVKNKPAHPKLTKLPNVMHSTPVIPDDVPHPVYETSKPSSTAIKRKPKPTGIDYKFNEDGLIAEIAEYLDSTYVQHYANSGNYQAMDIIIDAGHGMGFALGNVIKYNKRYGKKEGYNRKDLLKMIHYAILALYVHDYNVKASQEPNDE